ncbi:hypothetical protein K7432_010458 [Basidiobolus ranarum]|uniref:C2H2-type domain-containing protein n=1 Tax=Basidiobolus ranarum TaxID=34480 RepID=A0ABR2WNR1_9FUNG
MSLLATADFHHSDSAITAEHSDAFLVNDFQLYDNDEGVDDHYPLQSGVLNDYQFADSQPNLSVDAFATLDNAFTTPYTPSIDTFDPVPLMSTPFTPVVDCFNDMLMPFSPSIGYEGSMPLFNTPFIPTSNDFDIPISDSSGVIDTPLTLSLEDFNTQQLVSDVDTSGFIMPISMDTPFVQPENSFDFNSLANTPLHTAADIFSPAMLHGTPNIFPEGIDLTPFLTPATDFECDSFSTPGTPVDPSAADSIRNMNFLQFGNEADIYNELCNNEKEKYSTAFSLFAPLEEIADSHQNSECPASTSTTPDKDIFTVPAPQESSKSRLAAIKNKKYVCSYQGCDKGFARKFNLNVHLRSHFPDLARPFKCTECPKAFGRKHDLTRHLAAVHKATSLYHCDECEKEFSRRDALVRHLEKGCQLVN